MIKENIVTMDVLFKKIFSNEDIMINFIYPYLGVKEEDIKSIDYIDKELIRKFKDSKSGIMDLRVKLNNSIHVNIEIQRQKAVDDIIIRGLSYSTYIYVNNLKENILFINQDKSMSVIILDYDDKRFKKLITKVEFCDIMKPSDVAHSFETDIISVCVINLSKLEEEEEDIEDNDKEWLQFIRNYEELKVMEIKNKKIVKALELVKEFKADPKVRLEMEMEFVNNIDVMSREMYVKEEGKIEGKKETALEMLKKGLNINLISEITNLSVNEIKELK